MHLDTWQGLLCNMWDAREYGNIWRIGHILQYRAAVLLACCLLARTSVCGTGLAGIRGRALLCWQGMALQVSSAASKRQWAGFKSAAFRIDRAFCPHPLDQAGHRMLTPHDQACYRVPARTLPSNCFKPQCMQAGCVQNEQEDRQDKDKDIYRIGKEC